LKADAENMVNVISGDKLKIQTYREILDLDDQIDDANLNQDTKKSIELSEQADELKKKLGPEFYTLAKDLKDIDPHRPDQAYYRTSDETKKQTGPLFLSQRALSSCDTGAYSAHSEPAKINTAIITSTAIGAMTITPITTNDPADPARS
jgi:hypothetical protein